MNSEAGKYIIITGIIIVVVGVLIYFFHNRMNWIGNLPGDISIKKENFRFYFPLTTMIVVSVVVSVIIQIIRKLL